MLKLRAGTLGWFVSWYQLRQRGENNFYRDECYLHNHSHHAADSGSSGSSGASSGASDSW